MRVLGRSKLAGQNPDWAEGQAPVAAARAIPWAAQAQVILGLWLALSGFLWRHGNVAKFHGFALGLSLVVTNAWRLRTARPRLDLVMAGWLLFVTPLIAYECRATAWHNLALSFVMVLAALGREATG